MTYIVNFDRDSGKFIVRYPEEPLAVGQGKDLYAAIDDLERKLESEQNKIIQEKGKDPSSMKVIALAS